MNDETGSVIEEENIESVETTTPENESVIEETVEQTPPKKRRGRPPLSETKIGADTKTTGAKTGPKKRAVYGDQAAKSLSKQLMGLHIMAMHITGAPEMQIGENEADMLANAVINVAQEYNLSLSGKTGAAIQLFGVAAMVYLPRIQAINNRKRSEKARDITPVNNEAS
jgi:hypothetical protein